MKDQIDKLLRIQGLDLRIRDLELMLLALPEELDAVRRELVSRQEELKSKGAGIEEILAERRKLEGELEKNSEEIGKFSSQLNEVKTNEQYNALQKEIKALKEKNSAIEEEILIGMDRGEKLEEEKRNSGGEVRLAEGKAAAEEKRVEEDLRSIGVDIEKAIEERQVAAADVEKRFLVRYEAIRRGTDRQVLSRIERDACELCYRQVPPQRVVEVKKMVDLITCEGCGRILIWVG